jgi:hypothetical protein
MIKTTLFKIEKKFWYKNTPNIVKQFLLKFGFIVQFTLAYNVNFMTCNDFFVMEKYMVCFVLHQFVNAFNIVCKGLIFWPQVATMVVVVKEFKKLCWFLTMQQTIGQTHISIIKTTMYYCSTWVVFALVCWIINII